MFLLGKRKLETKRKSFCADMTKATAAPDIKLQYKQMVISTPPEVGATDCKIYRQPGEGALAACRTDAAGALKKTAVAFQEAAVSHEFCAKLGPN